MNGSTDPRQAGDTLWQAAQVKRLGDAFAESWRRGESPQIEVFLARAGADARPTLLKQLLQIETAQRRAAGQMPTVAEYAARFVDDIAVVQEALGDDGPTIVPDGATDRRGSDVLPADEAIVDLTAQQSPRVATTNEANRFRAVSLHATGGLGEVYVARDEQLDRKVALKRLRAKAAGRHDDQRRFVREAELTGKLEHPGVVPIYGLGRDADGNPYYAMRFIEGETLAAAIKRYHMTEETADDKPLQLQRLMRHFLDVCHAVDFAHSRGVLHRDLKPANVMLGAYGETLVVDWGLARPIGVGDGLDSNAEADDDPSPAAQPDSTRQGAIIGTLGFMSPEQARGDHDRLSPASDVFSLGSILFCILTDETPAREASQSAMVRDAQQGIVRDVRGVRPSVPRVPAAVCMKALSKRPEDRYPSARALSDDIERWLADEPVSAYREGVAERCGRWLRKHRTAAAAGVALAAAIAAASAIGMWAVKSEQRQTERQRIIADEQRTLAEQQRAAAETARDQEAVERQRADAARRTAEDERIRADHSAYAAHIQAADASWQADQSAEALAHLEACKPDLRGWEHDYLVAKFKQGFEIFASGQGALSAIAANREGTQVFSAGRDGMIRIWDVAAGRETRAVKAQVDSIVVAAVSGDFRQWVTTGTDGVIYLGNIVGDDPPRKLSGHGGAVTALAFSRDGKLLFSTGDDETLRIWNATDGSLLKSFAGMPLNSLIGSPDGKSIVGGADRAIQFVNIETGEATMKAAGNGRILDLDFSECAERSAAAYDDGLVRVWTGNESTAFRGHARAAVRMRFLPGGKHVASADVDGTIRLWDVDRNTELRVLRGHIGLTDVAPLGPDRIVSGGYDGTIRIWNVEQREFPQVLERDVEGLAGVGFIRGNPHFISGAGLIRLATRPTDQGNEASMQAITATCSAISRDDMRVVVGTDDGRLIVNDTDGKKLGELDRQEASVVGVAFGDDPNIVVTGTFDGGIKLWNLAAKKELRTLPGHGGPLACVAVSRDLRRVVSGGYDNLAKLCDATTGNQIGSLRGHGGPVLCAAFSPDGTKIVTGGFDKTVRIWDATDGRELAVLRGHAQAVTTIAYSPDGRRITSTSMEGRLKIWDPLTAQEILSLKGHDDTIRALAFDREGKRIITASNTKVILWDATPVERGDSADDSR